MQALGICASDKDYIRSMVCQSFDTPLPSCGIYCHVEQKITFVLRSWLRIDKKYMYIYIWYIELWSAHLCPVIIPLCSFLCIPPWDKNRKMLSGTWDGLMLLGEKHNRLAYDICWETFCQHTGLVNRGNIISMYFFYAHRQNNHSSQEPILTFYIGG